GRYRLTLAVGDGKTTVKGDVVVIALAASANHAPLLNVMLPARARVGAAVQATISASDEDGDGLTVSYTLVRPMGSKALLTGAETLKPSFVPDVPGSYLFSARADDG